MTNHKAQASVNPDVEPGKLLDRIAERIYQSLELQEILDTAVVEVCSFLQVDRVKIYQFDPDGSGVVVAESIPEKRLPSLLGLRFPASDIPPQAREMFVNARQRVIVDVASQRKTLSQRNLISASGATSGEDTRYSPVDSCHLQYLIAMGVTASLTVPILYQNQLWGLLVAHHTQPRPFSEQELQIVQLLVDQMPIAIAQGELLEQTKQQARQEATIRKLNAILHSGQDVGQVHQLALEQVITALSAIGGRLYLRADLIEHPAQVYRVGEQPTEALIEENPVWQKLLGWQGVLAVSQRSSSEVMTTWQYSRSSIETPKAKAVDELAPHLSGSAYFYTLADFAQDARLQPLMAAFETTSIRSLLIIPLQYQQQYVGCLTVFRPEVETETLWAGRCNPDQRNLRPRESFAAWRELKTGQVQGWNPGEVKLAQALGLYLYIAVMQRRVEELLRHHNSRDLLTGLPNRLLFEELLALSLVNLHQQGGMVAIMFLDLDRFKAINDTLGHAVGDRLLQQVTERLKTCLRPEDTMARWGDDEFTLLVSISCTEDAAKIAQTLLSTLAHPFRIENQDLHITATIGVALAPYDGEDAETLLRHADATLNRAKQQGKNHCLLYTPAMNTTALERLILGNSLYRAIDRQELLLHYQPQVDLKTGQVVAMEALLRWQHPDLGLISPNQFISIAEETGLICEIGEWVLRTACAQNRAWQLAGLPPLRIAVNLSARQFQQQNLVQTIIRILQETQLAPQYLEIEITESLVMQDVNFTVSVLRQMQNLGIAIAMDDFGTGYSSLGSLMHFPLNTLKIDRSFIQDLAKHTSNEAIITSVISLGHGLNLSLVAEGVETIEQLEFLRAANCNIIQGYFVSRPMDAQAAIQFLVEKMPQQLCKPMLPPAPLMTPQPVDESQRLAALYQYQILDTPIEAGFDDLTRLAAQICQTPIALISLIDEQRQWSKSRYGLDAIEMPRSLAFCAYAILQFDLLVVTDTLADERFAQNTLVTSDPKIRFYAGAPLRNSEGFVLGTLCVLDRVPRQLNPEQKTALKVLAEQVMTKLELHRSLQERQELEAQLSRARAATVAQQELEKTISVCKRTEKTLVEQIHLAQLVAQIGGILGRSEKLPILLQECVQALAQHLDLAFVGIWLLNATTNHLELQASCDRTDSIEHFSPKRASMSAFKVNSIVETGLAFYTNQLLTEPDLTDPLWVQQAELTAFAGYPLQIDQVVIGAMTLFAGQPIAKSTQAQLAAITDGIARCVEHKQTEALLLQQTQRERLVAEIAQRIRRSLDLDEILNTTVQEVRQFLQSDRVIIFRFKPDWSGVVTVESVANGFLPILRTVIDEPCFRNDYVSQYQQGRVRAIEDIFTAGISECHLNLLAELQVRANLVVPILQGEQLWGLLIAHHCSGPRHWRQLEISLLSQLATQVGIAIQQSELYQQVQHLATIDALTQTANRRQFDHYLHEKWQQMMRSHASLSLILCDIDFFKAYNDTYGHPAGDTCLRQVAGAISRASSRSEDLVARYGGEEFAIILPNTSLEGTLRVAERIREEVKALQLAHAQSRVGSYVTLSIGVASLIPAAGQSSASLIAAADQALYEAKAQGRDRVCVAKEDPTP